MSIKRRLSLYLGLTLIILTALVISVVGAAFRSFSIYDAKDKSRVAAALVRDGLTSHMVNGIMDKRHYFMERIGATSGIDKIWVVRSASVTDQYGQGFEGSNASDEIDISVFEQAESVETIYENIDNVKLRVTIPYIASPECLQCHTSNRGDVLGVVNIVFDVSEMRENGLRTIMNITIISIVVLALMIFLSNKGLSKYLELFESLTAAIKRGHDGDFSPRVKTSLTDESGKLAELLNSLYEHLNQTICSIDKKITILISSKENMEINPLERMEQIVDSLVDIYKFKKTIEIDRDKKEIYEHILTVIRRITGELCELRMFEIDAKRGAKYVGEESKEWYCAIGADGAICENCRALRSESAVFSDEFSRDICRHFKDGGCGKIYSCVPFRITAEISLLIMIVTESADEMDRVKSELEPLGSYIEAARPVLESRYLTRVLQESNLRDGLTGLYNRKFLDEFIDHIMRQASRTNTKYALLALDIDYFKMVNDTYGHDIGDMVLKGFSETLTQSVREADIAVRQGGEEFLIMLLNAEEENALKVAEKIRERFENRSFAATKGETLNKTVSIGVSMYPQDSDRMWQAIKLADIALYKAKNTGRNKVVRYTPDMNTVPGEKY